MTNDPPTEGRSDEETLPLSAGGRPSGPAAGGSPYAAHAVATERPGDEVGPYKLVALLGEGGFGAVWLAERRQPFVQQVALKLVKAGMDSKAVVARFEQERQALAVMNHPNVAKVLDGGLTASGRPYFAMEYVKGEPINKYCDGRKLPIADRLRLFTQVCDAVQHAHTKGLIHRDLKPGNVLVATGEGDQPRVKVIDFGVAKALTQRMTEHTVFTETGQMIGTPEYMSPEQAEPDANDIDTRTDVYSLGVMLYELLTGTLPFDPKELRSKAYREIQRIIREVDPPTPSTRISTIVGRDTALMTAIAAAWTVTQTLPVPGTPVATEIADIDGDGNDDVVTANADPVLQGAGTALPVLTLFRGGAAGFGGAVPIAPQGATAGLDVALVDADGDGDRDIVCVQRGLGTASAAVLVQVDTAGPGGPLTLGTETALNATRPTLCARGNLDGIGGEDLFLVDAGGGSAFLPTGPVAKPFLGAQPNPCPADLDHNHAVNGADLGLLLSNWGGSGIGDLNGDGTVNGADLGLLLSAWGPCGN